MTESTDSQDELEKSKTAVKQELAELTRLGEQLCQYSQARLASLPLTDRLLAAIAEAQKISSPPGRRRQVKYIGKLLRDIDLDALELAIRLQDQPHLEEVDRHHAAEQWRDRLLAEGDGAITELLAEAPTLDRQKLRQLVLAANRENTRSAPPKSARLLFRYLRDNLPEAAGK